MRPLHVVFGLMLSGCIPLDESPPATEGATFGHDEYLVPPGAPEGKLRVASYGMTYLQRRGAVGVSLHALHVRLALTDYGATPWTFDTREQHVELRDGEEIHPTFASVSVGATPRVVSVDHDDHVVDLFFLVPSRGREHVDPTPSFDAVWKVHTDAGMVSIRTPLDRPTEDDDADLDEADD